MYIITNKKDGSLYIGMTNNLYRRMYEHKHKSIISFSKKYNFTKLVYFKSTNKPRYAIQREKLLKKCYRKWKIALIEKENPEWKDLSEEWFD